MADNNDNSIQNNNQEDQKEEESILNNTQGSNAKQGKSKEEMMIWDLEIWKRAEQTKFKAYLKQLEYEFLTKCQDDWKEKEDKRGVNSLSSSSSSINVLSGISTALIIAHSSHDLLLNMDDRRAAPSVHPLP